MLQKAAIVYLISLLFFSFTYASAPSEFLALDIVAILVLLALFILVEAGVAAIFHFTPPLSRLILAGGITWNILFLNLVLNPGFIGLETHFQFGAMLIATFIGYATMNALDDSYKAAIPLGSGLTIAIAGIFIYAHFTSAAGEEKVIDHSAFVSERLLSAKFHKKPNIYLISFDSLIPKSLLRKHTNLTETPYHLVLEQNLNLFSNFFADRVPTRDSLNSLLALNISYFDALISSGEQYLFYTGLKKSPLFSLFSANGYETTTLYNSIYFGPDKGSHIDNYYVNNRDPRYGACQFIDIAGVRMFTFLGYCTLSKSNFAEFVYRQLGIITDISSIDYLMQRMEEGVQRSKPQILLAYIYKPGHTKQSYDHDSQEDREEFQRDFMEGSKLVATYMKRIFEFVSANDPEAIIYIFGDHGPWLSRRIKFPQAPSFFVQDRYGILGGIRLPTECALGGDLEYNYSFMTIARGMHLILECLTGESFGASEKNGYRLNLSTTKDSNHYENYLYE